MTSFDYIVIGAGSAGCVLADRLSSDPKVSVAIVEAGPRDRKLEIKMPAAFGKLFHTKYDWDLRTTSQPELKARELYWPRGRTLGGSSSLNAMMWVRGAAADYDRWAQDAPGWSYAEVLPYFQRAENRVGSNHGDVYGVGGPLYIEELRDPNPLRATFFEACAEAGHHRMAELNEPQLGGYAPTPVTQHRGRRWSAADGYLRRALKRDNVTLFVDTLTERIVLDGDRASGVVVKPADGSSQTLTARREVLLSAGAVHSPAVLQRSGVGAPEVLAAAGVEVRVPVDGVGRGLQDHLSVPVVMFTRDAPTLVDAEKPAELLKFLLQRRGMLTSNVGEGVLFGRSADDVAEPDLEFIFAPVPFVSHGELEPQGHGITIGPILLQPESSGTVTITSADPTRAPVVEPNYLTEGRDLERLVAGAAQARALFETAALRNEVTDPYLPTMELDDPAEHVRANAETLYHPTGTCAMGTGPDSVVDEQLRLRGVAGLRVVDASVIPHIIRGHTHAPTVMIAERAADMLRN